MLVRFSLSLAEIFKNVERVERITCVIPQCKAPHLLGGHDLPYISTCWLKIREVRFSTLAEARPDVSEKTIEAMLSVKVSPWSTRPARLDRAEVNSCRWFFYMQHPSLSLGAKATFTGRLGAKKRKTPGRSLTFLGFNMGLI